MVGKFEKFIQDDICQTIGTEIGFLKVRACIVEYIRIPNEYVRIEKNANECMRIEKTQLCLQIKKVNAKCKGKQCNLAHFVHGAWEIICPMNL